MSYKNEYQGKVVLITGASSGFGRGTAVELAKRGASVVLAARGEDKLAEVLGECKGKAVAVSTDASDPQAVASLAEKAIAAFGRIYVWINDAGVAAIGKFDQVPLADHEQVIKTNLLGTV
jgi:NADP-dependent 3-hydroxy acid dehydrogenase YdfG